MCDTIAECAAVTRCQDLGATDTDTAKSRAANFIYRALGIEMMRGTAALRAYRMGMILAGNQSARSAAARRRWARTRWEEEQEAYFYAHNYGSVSYERPW